MAKLNLRNNPSNDAPDNSRRTHVRTLTDPDIAYATDTGDQSANFQPSSTSFDSGYLSAPSVAAAGATSGTTVPNAAAAGPSTAAGGGLVINVTYDQSQSSLPAGFVAAVNYVVNYYESVFTNPVTVNIDVGYGEIDGQSLGSGALGESETYIDSVAYSQAVAALKAD